MQASSLFRSRPVKHPPAGAVAPGEAARRAPAAPERRPRLLLYGINFAPELTGIGRYSGDLAAWLAEQGFAVEVVTAYPYYPHWRLPRGSPSWRWSRESWKGVRVTRCPLWVPRQPRTLTRIAHLLSFALSSSPALLLAALRHRPDILLVVEPTFLCTPAALLTARLVRARSWLHVQDIEIGAAGGLGLLGRRRLSAGVMRVYGRLLGAFHRVTTLSERMRDKLVELTGRSGIELFPNWVDVERVRPVDASGLRAALGVSPAEIVVLYAGNLGEKQGVGSLLEAAAALEADPRLRFIICGSGAARARIEAALPSHPNVRLLDPQPDDRFVELMSAADIHVLPQKPGVTHYVMPSKIGAMLASGRAIVAQVDRECAIRRDLDGCALFVEPGGAEALALAIEQLANDPAKRHRLGALARDTSLMHAKGLVLSRQMAVLCSWLARD